MTHDQEEALELADRVAILNAGRLEQVGTADEVYDQAASAFVMSFVGDTSSIPVVCDGTRILHHGEPIECDVERSFDGEGRLYVRPKDIEIVDPAPGRLTAKVINVHRTMSGRRAQLAVGREPCVIEAEVSLDKGLSVGDRVALQIHRGRLFAS